MLEPFKLPRSVFSRLKTSMALMEFSWYLLNGIFSLSYRGKVGNGNGTTVVLIEGLLTLSNVHEKVKFFEIIQARQPRGNTNDPFGLKRFFSCRNVPDKFLA